jgi:hypothetical protein
MGLAFAKFIVPNLDDYVTYENQDTFEGSLVSYDTDFILGATLT